MTSDADTTAAIVTTSEPSDGWVGIRAECHICGYVVFTGALVRVKRDWGAYLLRGHYEQHAPGRALDITVDWEVSADCSVCDDGGDIRHEDDGLTCEKCWTTWSIDGTCGERADQ